MGYSEKLGKDLENATFLGGAILSSEWLAIIMVIERGGDIWEETPPARVFLIPFGAVNKSENWKRSSWDKNSRVFPMIVQESEDVALSVDSVGGVWHRDIKTSSKGEKGIRINGQRAVFKSFSGLKNIHGTVYVVGTFRNVMRREGKDRWSVFASEAMIDEAHVRYREAAKKDTIYDTGFNCIDGFSADRNLYAAGDASDVWRYDGKGWIPVDIGIFDEKIISICCAEDGFVYMGTQRTGKFIRGKDDNWEEIKTPFENDDITSIVSFKNKVYFSTPSRLYVYDDNEVKTVQYNTATKEVPANAGFLDARDGWLLSVGNSSISIYDGQEWQILYGASLVDAQTAYELANDMFKKSVDLMDAVEEGLSQQK